MSFSIRECNKLFLRTGWQDHPTSTSTDKHKATCHPVTITVNHGLKISVGNPDAQSAKEKYDELQLQSALAVKME